ncbi:MAG TPA: SH3 domain-containing protein [Candidatus Limnocylindria bacterium]|nr:SH3 domain-containing protein [Candidatus Limnocylindria bacterium]
MARSAALKHEPRFAAAAIEKVRLGTRVTVLSKERDWFKVKVKPSGNVGYLRKEYLAAANIR